ncbi:UNVERIFIED_CONTAM: Primary amine oxidase [Sesamum radiatum]|uniref:Amine oxidase n=1 Tax=Sesamum radiatum TaxID=300843 RepID=A0AAW2MEA1_SESRA
MEARNLLRYTFFLFFILLLVLFTLSNLPSPPSDKAEMLDCAAYSPWCTSKNRIQSKKPDFLQKPTNPTRRSHSADVPHHPLDPLTVTELNTVRKIIQAHDFFKNKAYALHSVVLEEPEKKLVLRWKKGEPLPPRKAAVVARVGGASHVLTVDLGSGEVTRHETGHMSGYPTMTVEDMTSVTWAPLASADFNRTVVERGVDLADLACLPISLGWFVVVS